MPYDAEVTNRHSMEEIRNANSAMPLYAAVEKTLLGRIEAGVYSKDELMPSEHDLSRELNVSRQTVREAIRRLADAGLVSRHPGIGTRINGTRRKARYTYPVGSLADLVEHVREVPLKVHSADVIEARGALATFLKCRQGTSWLHVKGQRHHVGESMPLAVSELYIRNRFANLREKLWDLKGPVHMLIETVYGEFIEEIQQEIRSVIATGEIARTLGIEPGSAALEIQRRFLGKAGRMVIYGCATYPASRFSYTVNFRRDVEMS
ncbi:MAG: GntR family transcriptional regulator [Rhizobiaceae bacterium]|nr:GntR family transcriptional regulator [Rhizobiaceae bacterium]